MGADEEATLAMLGGHREVMERLIAARRYPEPADRRHLRNALIKTGLTE